jgi:hypothetical protein
MSKLVSDVVAEGPPPAWSHFSTPREPVKQRVTRDFSTNTKDTKDAGVPRTSLSEVSDYGSHLEIAGFCSPISKNSDTSTNGNRADSLNLGPKLIIPNPQHPKISLLEALEALDSQEKVCVPLTYAEYH